MWVVSVLVIVTSAFPFVFENKTRSPTWITGVSFTVSPISQTEVAGSVTERPFAAIVPSFVAAVPVRGGVWIIGMNSSTVRIVTMSVDDPMMLGPSWYPVVMAERFGVVSAVSV